MANGPEDEASGWLLIDWQRAEDDVRRLRQRIFTATQALLPPEPSGLA